MFCQYSIMVQTIVQHETDVVMLQYIGVSFYWFPGMSFFLFFG